MFITYRDKIYGENKTRIGVRLCGERGYELLVERKQKGKATQ